MLSSHHIAVGLAKCRFTDKVSTSCLSKRCECVRMDKLEGVSTFGTLHSYGLVTYEQITNE